jgi:hypothetical protein
MFDRLLAINCQATIILSLRDNGASPFQRFAGALNTALLRFAIPRALLRRDRRAVCNPFDMLPEIGVFPF